MKLLAVYWIVAAIWISLANSANYEGYKTYRIWTTNEEDFDILNRFVNNKQFDFWSPPNKNNRSTDVMVQPLVQYKFECLLEDRQITYKVLIENVGSTIRKQNEFYKSRSKLEGSITFDQYWHHDDFNKYLEQLAENYSSIVKVETIGQSHENRDMKIIRISNSTQRDSNPVIFIDAGIHAREWIAPAVALYVIQQLVEHPENSYLFEKVDWIILPSINPDGYEYSWTDDRFWRKTRTQQGDCIGVDANRNFAYGWGKRGSSNKPCSDTYAGPEAFSEVETRNVRDLIMNTSNIALYVTVHSYSRVIIYPWGYTDELPEDVDELKEVGKKVGEAIEKVSGTEYGVGDTWSVMYPAAGTSHDWAKGAANVSLSYTIELPGGGEYGYDLPEDRILGVVTETFEGFKAFHSYIENKFSQK